MTKQHFIKLAEYIRDTDGYCEPFTEAQIEHLANFCHSTNPAFKRGRWKEYIARRCGPNGGTIKNQSGSTATDCLWLTLAGLSILALTFTVGALPALIVFAQLATIIRGVL